MNQNARRAARIGGVVAAVAAALLAGHTLVSAAPSPTGSAQLPGPAGPATVTVQRGDVTETVVLQASISASPQFIVVATRNGGVAYAAGSATGSTVKSGTRLFSDAGTPVLAPVTARLDRWLVPDGSTVAAGVPVALMTYAGFGEVAALPAGAAYRILQGSLTARASINDGPGPFDCAILPSPPTAAGAGAGADGTGGPGVVCAIPMTTRAYAGLSGLVAVHSGQARDVLVLPCTAVAGTAEAGEVSVLSGGHVTTTPVTLGVTDGSTVEITAGLHEGDVVLATAPVLDGSS